MSAIIVNMLGVSLLSDGKQWSTLILSFRIKGLIISLFVGLAINFNKYFDVPRLPGTCKDILVMMLYPVYIRGLLCRRDGNAR